VAVGPRQRLLGAGQGLPQPWGSSGDNELGNILQEAVKLKSAQMGEKRKRYETWPYFVQHTLFHGEKDDFKAWRQLPFPEKMKISEGIKDEGNALYAKGNWSDASDKYEEAATLVYYCYSTDPGWRKNNRGIDDDVLVLVDDVGTTEEEAAQQRRLRLTCCLNLAACKQKLQKYDEVIAACDVALELDPRSIKALYRRAEARVRPTKSTGYDHDLAIDDLKKAHEVDPKNQVVERLLVKLRAERKIQREKDEATFAGMFGRGTIYKESLKELAPAEEKGEPDMQDIRKRIESMSDDDPLWKRTQDAELLRDLYMRNGKEEEARELNEKIKAAKQALKERERPTLDWENPSPEMVQDAKQYDLDLTDPLVVAELKRLEREGINSTSPDEEPPPAATAFDGGVPPLSEADSVPVPWMRYGLLLAAMIAFWRLLDSGFFRWGPLWLWKQVLLRLICALTGFGCVDEPDDERGSIFGSAVYRKLAGLFGGDVDDGDL